MPRILLTSGPTRQYLDPVRYLSNGSSGRMGKALAEAALEAGHEVVIVSGPVEVGYPQAARVLPVVSTEEMLEACLSVFPQCDGLIAAAAPCDYRPKIVASAEDPQDGRHAGSAVRGNARRCRPSRRDQDLAMDGRLCPGDRRPADAGHAEAGTQEVRPYRGERSRRDARGRNEGRGDRRRGEVLAALAGSKRHVAKALLQVIQARLNARQRSLTCRVDAPTAS